MVNKRQPTYEIIYLKACVQIILTQGTGTSISKQSRDSQQQTLNLLNASKPTSTTCKAVSSTVNASAVAVLASTSKAKLLKYRMHQHSMPTNECQIKIHNKKVSKP